MSPMSLSPHLVSPPLHLSHQFPLGHTIVNGNDHTLALPGSFSLVPSHSQSPFHVPSPQRPLNPLSAAASSSATRPPRPQLRVMTPVLPGSHEHVYQPVPVRHPALINSAPLFLSTTWPIDSHQRNKVYEKTFDYNEMDVNRHAQKIENGHGHMRGFYMKPFSERIRSLIGNLVLSDRGRRGSNEKGSDRNEESGGDLHDAYFNHTHIGTPIRPHRSPGTASFQVTTHVDMTSINPSLRLSPFLSKGKNLLGTPEMLMSHFSDTSGSSSEYEDACGDDWECGE